MFYYVCVLGYVSGDGLWWFVVGIMVGDNGRGYGRDFGVNIEEREERRGRRGGGWRW